MSTPPVRIAVYGELNMNLVDGSSVWLQSVALMLAAVPGARVTVLLRVPRERDVLLAPLDAHPGVEVVDGAAHAADPRRLTPAEAVDALAALDAHERFDVVLLRGAAVVAAAAASGRFDDRLWAYYVPPHADEADADAVAVRGWAGACHRILAQTPAIRDRIARLAPDAADRLVLLPPMVPARVDAPTLPGAARPVRTLLYAGKISPEYFFFEMLELLRRLRETSPDVVLHVVGDKVHNPPQDPDFHPRATAALGETDGLIWHGAVTRTRVAELLADADVALSIRHPSMDASTELSTKVLEYGAAGTPVVLNRNDVHVALLGADYPLLVDGVDGLGGAVEAVLRLGDDPAAWALAVERAWEASGAHTFARVAEHVAPHLPRGPAHTRRLLAAGHSFPFLDGILALARAGGAEVREDRWQHHATHEEEGSRAALAWADTILCEWCMGNAIWYSRHVGGDQRLVVRFHRMELETDYPASVDLDRVDALVFVAEHVRAQACARYGWPDDHPSLRVVPNAVDGDALARPKLPGSEFAIGMIGIVPMLKRLDLALDVLERVRARDDRFHLVLKGRGPWEFPWMERRPEERRFYAAAFGRIERSPLLRGAVRLEPFGDDVPDYLRTVGWMLSPSDVEGHAVGLAEAMASGCVPVVLERAGALEQYPAAWVHAGADEAAAAILAVHAAGGPAADGAQAAAFARRWDRPALEPAWRELLALPPRPEPVA